MSAQSQKKAPVKNTASTFFPLPEPIELAKLAAILRPGSQPKAALETAMKFYVEAVFFLCELPSTRREFLNRFGSEERRREFSRRRMKKMIEDTWAHGLTLDPAKDDDPVRQYVTAKGLSWKRAQSVLDNYRRSCNAFAKDTPPVLRRYVEGIIARCVRPSDGRETYIIPKFMLDGIVESAKRRRKESKRKSWHNRKPARDARLKNPQAES